MCGRPILFGGFCIHSLQNIYITRRLFPHILKLKECKLVSVELKLKAAGITYNKKLMFMFIVNGLNPGVLVVSLFIVIVRVKLVFKKTSVGD